MGDVGNLLLGHLKRFQTTLERMDRRIGELTVRQSETRAAVQARLDRIERRLELND